VSPVLLVSLVIPALFEFGYILGNPAIKFNNILSGINCYSENTIYKKSTGFQGIPLDSYILARICGGV
jgi:hypothetical protein